MAQALPQGGGASGSYSPLVTGYWLVNGGSRGAGVIYASGLRSLHNIHAAWLGGTAASIKQNLPAAIRQLGVFGLSEADPNTIAATATSHKVAWYKQTPNGAVPDNTFTLAAATAPLGGVLGSAVKGVLDYAGLTDAFGLGGTSDAPLTDAGAGLGDTSSADSTASDSTAKDSNSNDYLGTKAAVPAASTAAGELANIWDAITKDAAYAGVLVLALLLGGLLMFHGLTGGRHGGGDKIRVVPI